MKKPLNSKLPAPYNQMSAKDLERATARYDAEFIADQSQELSPVQKSRLQRAKRRGRPRVGEGAEKIRISMERSLLKQADALALKRKLSRSQLISEALGKLIRSKAS
jgi:hypothetical protein